MPKRESKRYTIVSQESVDWLVGETQTLNHPQPRSFDWLVGGMGESQYLTIIGETKNVISSPSS